MSYDPDHNCAHCVRLVEFREHYRCQEPDWHNGPVETWVSENGDADVELLIVGLAPGLKGANRTGRAFTGDASGDALFAALQKIDFAYQQKKAPNGEGISLSRCAITNAVRCVPPQNKPIGSEINNCRPFLVSTFERFKYLKVIVTLGKIAHDSTIRALGRRVAAHKFTHSGVHELDNYLVISSYHCSRYNMNTGVLTPRRFNAVFKKAKAKLDLK